jgi:hypothetical protein
VLSTLPTDRHDFQERPTMLLYEVLARDRMRDDQRRARQTLLASRLTAARRWQRLARYADRRARRAAERL